MKKIKRPNITAIFICCCYFCLFFVVVPLRTNDVCFFLRGLLWKSFYYCYINTVQERSSRTTLWNIPELWAVLPRKPVYSARYCHDNYQCLSPSPVKPTLVIVVGPPTPLQRKSPTVPCSMYCSWLPLDWFVFISLELWLKKKWTYCLNI